MGVWIALVGGGLGIAWYVNRHGGSSGTGNTPATPVEDTGSGSYDTVGPSAGNSSASDSAPSSPQTNEDWGKQAIDYLIASGYDPSASNQAVNLYLNNGKLTVAQTALINIALRKLGSPPSPVGATDTNPPPTGNPGQTTPAKLLPAPTRIAATNRSSSSITLEWNGVSGAKGYRIYRSDRATHIGETTSTHYTVTGLSAGHTYSFHLRTLNADKKYGDRSGDYHVTTLKTKQHTKTVHHKVKPGETLQDIAYYYYGDRDFWRRIYDANKSKIKNIDNPPNGVTLTIPSATRHI